MRADRAFGDILRALATVRRVEGTTKGDLALNDFAALQAKGGDTEGAIATTHRIEDGSVRARALVRVAETQIGLSSR